jgi:hypothetical protein
LTGSNVIAGGHSEMAWTEMATGRARDATLSRVSTRLESDSCVAPGVTEVFEQEAVAPAVGTVEAGDWVAGSSARRSKETALSAATAASDPAE